ncbi:hypothetical protein [Intestinirhabdus alba]|jgi:hypothetical protein|uniref:Uncharacterized protein n=1 Tax=Intestinirhabdus alba TaxID=2899544 RepID=A0A6L6IN89_9ENTR|nr:hypothetical protein [Intestinirhabdus alba]MTH47434.1 hypothetical protein [Intestinirhabdus alba]
MAKQLKTIKCPQCGSTQKTALAAEHYLCQSCHSEYYLDNDDINVHIRHHEPPPHKECLPEDEIRLLKTLGLIVVGLLLLSGALTLFFRFEKAAIPVKHTSSSTSTTASPTSELKKPARYTTFVCSFLPHSQQKIYLSVVEKVSGSGVQQQADDPESGFYAVFTDLTTKKIVKKVRINSHAKARWGTPSKSWSIREFADGKIYLILLQRELFQLNSDTLSIDPVGETFFSGHKAFQSGIATIDFVSHSQGSGFTILSNDGKRLYYYPVIDKVYAGDDAIYNASHFMRNLLPDHSPATLYKFVGPKFPKEGDKKELIKITYLNNNGGPISIPQRLNWYEGYDPESKTYVGPATKIRVLDDADRYRIINFKNLTDPDRIYFSPVIMYYDQKNLFIAVKENASPDAAYNLQKLDPDSGAVLWTIPSPGIQDIYPFDDGFLMEKDCTHLYTIDADGKTQTTYTLTYEE